MKLSLTNKYMHLLILILVLMSVVLFKYWHDNRKPSLTDVIKLIELKDNISVTDNTITVYGTEFNTILNIDKQKAVKYKFNNIVVNDVQIKQNDNKSLLYYEDTANKYVLKSEYYLKPSSNDIKFNFENKSYTFKLNLVYLNNFNSDRLDADNWLQKPSNWVSASNKKLLLDRTKTDSAKMNFIGFRRRFDDDIQVSVDFKIQGHPVYTTFFLREGLSLTIGSNDNKTIQLIRAVNVDGNPVNEKLDQQYYKFAVGSKYKLVMKRTGHKYIYDILDSDNNSIKHIEYNDNNDTGNIINYYKGIGIGLWKNGRGIEINTIKIESKEKL